jgi:putative ABC transport system permease protein
MTLPFHTVLALRQMRYKGMGLIGPFAGVCVAVILVFIQLGFKNALTGSVLNFDRALIADIVITGSQFETIAFAPPWFARSIIYQAQGVAGVQRVVPVYVNLAQLRDPDHGDLLASRFIGFDPDDPVLALPVLARYVDTLRLPSVALIDERSRNQLTNVADRVAHGRSERLYLQNPALPTAAHLDLVGTFSLGPDFTLMSSVVLSDLNFYRLFQLPPDRVSLGLVTTRPDADPRRVRDELAARLGDGVHVSLRRDFIEAESRYFSDRTPVGVVTMVGALVGVLIGVVFVVEVLHGIIESNLSEYAVLRAMGYGNRFFLALVLQIAMVAGAAAFVASLVITLLCYGLLEHATRLTFALESGTVASVLLGTLAMSGLAAVFALRKLLRSNPIDLFA